MFIKEKVLSLLCILILPPTSGPNSLYTKVKIAEKKIKKSQAKARWRKHLRNQELPKKLY